MIVKNFRQIFQDNEAEIFEGHILKSDSELIEKISYFGSGETEFHTIDIERIIMEKETLYNLLLNVKHKGYLINSDNINKALEYYKP